MVSKTSAGGTASTSSATRPFVTRQASTGNEIENIYRHVDTQISAVRSEMKGEIATVMATIREAEAQRSIDYRDLTTSIEGVRSALPTKSDMWKIVGTVTGGGVALLALLWTVFGSGAAITGSFADKVLEQREQQSDINKKLDKLIESKVSNDKPQASPPKR